MIRKRHLSLYGLQYTTFALALLLLAHCVPAAKANGIQIDSVAKKPYKSELFSWEKLIVSGSLIAIGTFGAYSPWFKSLNKNIDTGLSDLRGDNYVRCDNLIQYLPVTTYGALGFIPGIKHQNPFKDRLMAGLTAYGIMAVIVNGTKYTVRESRPDTGQRNSFPSGHTATAFTGAELMRLEYGNAIGAAGYAVALGVAFMRLYNQRHWLNDIIAGAGVGILSANIGYWLLPYERSIFNNKDMTLCLLPLVSADKQVGFTFNILY